MKDLRDNAGDGEKGSNLPSFTRMGGYCLQSEIVGQGGKENKSTAGSKGEKVLVKT